MYLDCIEAFYGSLTTRGLSPLPLYILDNEELTFRDIRYYVICT
jgi:hypothetical protein